MRLGALEAHDGEVARVSYPEDRVEEVTSIRRHGTMTLRPTSRGKIIGQDPKVREVLGTIDRVARSACTVLVTGESGTGKELVVAALHDASDRRAAPLVTINCGAIPLELVESELFGHARGAFTGAQAQRRGHVASAEGGTLFLDEVGELPMQVQVKLLRLLQQREYTPLGESRAIKCDVRIVAATNRDLEEEVRAGRFREDLYYRLNVIHIHLPSLRERRSDIRLLATHFYSVFAQRSGRTDLGGFSDSALAAIEAFSWPGNVRALENAIERGVLLARGPLVEAEDVLGRGAGRGRPAVESTANAGADPRREPDANAASAANVERTTGVFERKEPRAIALPEPPPVTVQIHMPPPEANPGSPSPAPAAPTSIQAVVPIGVAGLRHGSNPAFPRVLPNTGVDLFSAVEQYQNNLIRQALVRTGGNKNRAAQLLGLNRTTLVEMIRRRGLGT